MKRKIPTLKEVLAEGGLMDVPETANFLRVSIPSVYACEGREVPVHQAGDQGVRFDPVELQVWVDERRAR